MPTSTKAKLATVTVVYWIFFSYIIVALVYWYISLNKQNDSMASLSRSQLNADDPQYMYKMLAIDDYHHRKTMQYIGEGSVFFLVIIIGGVFVFQATRKQLRLGQQQQNFMMAITHELKTPIAVTRLNLETLQKRKLEETQQSRLIGNTLEEANRLNDLCNNILLTAQLEAGTSKANKEEVELGDLARNSVTQFIRRFPNRQINFVSTEETAVLGEPLMLQMLVNNLLENALKYSPKDKPIQALVKLENGKVLFQVLDNGPGINDEEKKKIWDKFYRIGDERTRTSKGTGLGLYLCKRIVKDHKGDITVTNNQPSGCIFTVSFKAI